MTLNTSSDGLHKCSVCALAFEKPADADYPPQLMPDFPHPAVPPKVLNSLPVSVSKRAT